MDWIKWRFLRYRDDGPEDEDHEMEMTVCSSWSEYLIIRIVTLTALLTVFALGFIVREQYRYDETIHTDRLDKDACRYMRLHVLCGNIGFVVLPSSICVTYRMFCIFSTKPLTIVHGISALIIIPFITFTFLSGNNFDSVIDYNEMKLYKSGHSSLGMLSTIVYALSMVSVVILLTKTREKFGSIHSILGGALVICGGITAISGCESRRYLFINMKDGEEKHSYYNHSVGLYIYEICVIILVIFVLVLTGVRSLRNISTIIYPDDGW